MKEIRVETAHLPAEQIDSLEELCPFGAIEVREGRAGITAGCRMCMLCVKKGPAGVFTLVETESGEAGTPDLEAWRGIAVYIDQVEGEVHPVSFELIGKAREMAAKAGEPVYALLPGSGLDRAAKEVLRYGVDGLYLYDQPELAHFRIEPYTAALEDFINEVKPAVVLVGGTAVGRSLAPRAAARFRTGLTADCTVLDIGVKAALDQIRPAFGGNIMAHIHTPKHRPQFATVRYKIFSAPEPGADTTGEGEIFRRTLPAARCASGIRVLDVKPKERQAGIEEAEVIIVAGRGLKKREDMRMIEELAELLDAEVAATRSLIEAGWVDPRRQIGLSGRTVKPKLIITCGVSGAIQFVAGMNSAERIVAINTDREAPIMKVAHLALQGDIYEILPELTAKIRNGAAAPEEVLQ